MNNRVFKAPLVLGHSLEQFLKNGADGNTIQPVVKTRNGYMNAPACYCHGHIVEAELERYHKRVSVFLTIKPLGMVRTCSFEFQSWDEVTHEKLLEFMEKTWRLLNSAVPRYLAKIEHCKKHPKDGQTFDQLNVHGRNVVRDYWTDNKIYSRLVND